MNGTSTQRTGKAFVRRDRIKICISIDRIDTSEAVNQDFKRESRTVAQKGHN